MYNTDYGTLTEVKSPNPSSFGYLLLYVLVPIMVVFQTRNSHSIYVLISYRYLAVISSFFIYLAYSLISTY